MPSDTTLPGAIGWVLWYVGELAFKWVPGFALSLTAGPGEGSATAVSRPPNITEAVRVQDVVTFLQNSSPPGTYDQLYRDWNILVGVSIALSLIFGAWLVYSVTRTFQIRQAEFKRFQAAAQPVKHGDVPKARLRWDRILEEASSESDQNRRLAILEADIMLSELLDQLGYKGETIADKMRQVQKADFNSIDFAWEAHRARNRAAHEAGYTLSVDDTMKIISLYNRVFREFGFIEEH